MKQPANHSRNEKVKSSILLGGSTTHRVLLMRDKASSLCPQKAGGMFVLRTSGVAGMVTQTYVGTTS